MIGSFRNTGLVAVLSILFVSLTYAQQQRPNIVMIVVDDMRYDEFAAGGHTYLETPSIDRLVIEGATFSNAYHVSPLCSPNRASLLTGQYVSRHGILDNTSRSQASHRLDLFPKVLQQIGYTTAHVGKWHMGNDPTPRPGYDYWVSFSGQGKVTNPELYEDGRVHRVTGYVTDIFTDRAVEFIKRSQQNNKPFFLFLAHKAVHPESVQRDDGSIVLDGERSYTPAPRHRGRYSDKTIRRSPAYGFSKEEEETKPVLRDALEFKHSPAIQEAFANVIDNGISEQTVRRRAEMMLSVDEGLGRIMDTLKTIGKLDNTLIIFTSDNGFFYGEHGLSVERRLPYEESVKAPLLMRYPPVIRPGTRIEGLVTSMDLAPTVLEVANTPVPATIQGVSLLPMIAEKTSDVHKAILMEYYSHENPFPWTVNLDYRAVRQGRFKYIQWLRFENQAELYDLEKDPFEQQNLARDPIFAEEVSDLQQRLNHLVLQSMNLE